MPIETSLPLAQGDHHSNIRTPAPGLDPSAQLEENCVKVLGDHLIGISEAEILAMLDRWPQSPKIMGAVIERPFLTETVILRLAGLTPPALYERLVSRHALPPQFRRETLKRSRSRPDWWKQELFRSRA